VQGEWKPKQISNPAYKGKWVHPEIDNPDYQPDEHLYRYTDIGAIGFDLWQVCAEHIYCNSICSDTVELGIHRFVGCYGKRIILTMMYFFEITVSCWEF